MRPLTSAALLTRSAQVGGRQETPAYLLKDLRPGHAVAGPAVLIDDISTVVVEPRCTAHVTGGRDLRIEVGGDAGAPARAQTECDPIQLAVFSHRCGWCTACRHPCPHWRT